MAGDGELSAAAPDADGGCGGGDDDRLVEIVDIRCTVHNAAAAAAGYLVPPLPSAIAGAVAVIVAGREMGPADTRDDGKRVSSCQTDRDSRSLDKHSCASVVIQLYTSSVSSILDKNGKINLNWRKTHLAMGMSHRRTRPLVPRTHSFWPVQYTRYTI